MGRIPLLLFALVGLLASVVVGQAAASLSGAAGPSDSRLPFAATGTFTLAAELPVRYPPTTCPTGTPGSIECFARTGSKTIRGLGGVTESYPYLVDGSPVGCGVDEVRVLPAAVRLSVAGKGEIEIRVAGSGCLRRVPPEPVRGEEAFTITGGSGVYASVSGEGTMGHVSNGPFSAWSGRDTWTGRLVVPGLEFDLSAPIMAGARNRTVHAPRRKKRLRVKYTVSARDDVDGLIRAACQPRSGSWFRVGRTRVRCSATDTSGNESTAAFIVTVRRAR